MHIVGVQIVIQNTKMHLTTIDKQHDIDLKLYALTFKVGKYNTRTFLKCFNYINYDYKSIMFKLIMAKVFLFPYKGSLQK